eukprot:4271469-Amphidinium_carterae.1
MSRLAEETVRPGSRSNKAEENPPMVPSSGGAPSRWVLRTSGARSHVDFLFLELAAVLTLEIREVVFPFNGLTLSIWRELKKAACRTTRRCLGW